MEEKKQVENFEKFKHYFHESWHNSIENFMNSEEFIKIQEGVKQSKGKLLPNKGEVIFRVFKETPLNEVKVVFLALSPYPQVGVSDGLAFSNSLTKIESPSLKIIFDALEEDLKYKDGRNKDLSRWSKEGVLLLNSALTCEIGVPKSHLELWKPLINYLFLQVFNQKELKIVYFGADARVYQTLENKQLHKSLCIEHPAFSARENRGLRHNNLFSWCNKMLKLEGKSEIKWMEYSNELPWQGEEKQEYKEFI